MIFVARPLGQIVMDVDDPGAIENMAGGHKRLGHLGRKTKIKERRERQPHAAPLVGDGRPAPAAGHLAGQNSVMDVLLAVIEFKAVHSLDDSDVTLVEDGRPLHGRAVQAPACGAVADFGVHRVGAHLDLNRLAKAACPVFDDKALIRHRRVFRSEFFFHFVLEILSAQ